MGSTKVNVPAPPKMSGEEQELLRQQANQLGTISGILKQSQSQQTEAQDLYKQLSGLYDKGPNGAFTLNQAKVDALRAQQEQYGQMADEISALQSQRYLKALKGELPVSEATLQRKDKEFSLLRENLARRGGGEIVGDSPEGSYGTSSAAAQNLGEFQRTYKLIQDAEARGELASGGMGAAPGTTSLNSYNSSFGYSPANLIPSYGSLASGYGAAAQPYTQQRQLQYQASLQQAALRSQGGAAGMGLLGMGGSAAIMSGYPLIGAGVLGAGYLMSNR